MSDIKISISSEHQITVHIFFCHLMYCSQSIALIDKYSGVNCEMQTEMIKMVGKGMSITSL